MAAGLDSGQRRKNMVPADELRNLRTSLERAHGYAIGPGTWNLIVQERYAEQWMRAPVRDRPTVLAEIQAFLRRVQGARMDDMRAMNAKTRKRPKPVGRPS